MEDLGRSQGALEGGRASIGQTEHWQCSDRAPLTIVLPKEFLSLASPWPHSQMPPLFSGFSVCQAQEGGGEAKDPMLAQTCLGNFMNKNKFSTLRDL